MEGPRVMAKVLVGTEVTNDGDGEISTVTGVWEPVDGSTVAAVQRSYFDLSGYNLDDLTTFVQGVEVQEPGPLAGSDTNNQLLEIISTEFISDSEIVAFTNTNGFSGPGYSVSTNNMDQVIFGRRRLYTSDTSPGIAPIIPVLHYSSTWGTAHAITADKVHITRIIITSSANSVTSVSDANFVLTAIIGKEKSLTYLMRQKRSYELSMGP